MNAPERDFGEPRHRPRVAFLARNLRVGGAERTYLNLANHVRQVTPVTVLLRRRGGLLHELSDGLELHSLDAPTAGGLLSADLLEEMPGGSPSQLLLECHRLRQLVDTLQIRVVTSFLMRAHLVALLVKILFRPQLRVVLNIHEHMSESARFLYPKRRDRAVAHWVARRLFPRADRIVVVADELGRDLMAKFGVPAALLQTLANPVDLDRIRTLAIQPVEPPFPEDDRRPTICAIGRLVYLKGYDVLLRAVAEFRSALPARLVFVGDGDEHSALVALATRLGLENDVRFVGWQRNPWAYLRGAQVLALSSRTEAFPSVLTEAMAVGVPIVAAECSAGIRDCLDGGKAGLLVSPDDAEALARALHRVLSEPALAMSLSANGTKHVSQFALTRRVAAYETMLLETDRN